MVIGKIVICLSSNSLVYSELSKYVSFIAHLILKTGCIDIYDVNLSLLALGIL